MRQSVTCVLMPALLLLFIAVTATAQKPDAHISEAMKPEHLMGYLDKYLMSTQDHIYFTYVRHLWGFKSLHIHKYDKKFNLIESKEISASDKHNYFITAFGLDHHLYLWTYKKDLKANTAEYFLTKMDDNIKTVEVKSLGTFEAKRGPDLNYHEIFHSRDSTKMALLSIPTDRDSKKDMVEARVMVFDKNLKAIWEKRVTLPFTQRDFDYHASLLHDNGTFYLGGTRVPDKKTRFPALFTISESGLKQVEMKNQSKVSDKQALLQLEDGSIVYSGFIGPYQGQVGEGIWTALVDAASAKVVKESNYAFSLEDFDKFDRLERLRTATGHKGLDIIFGKTLLHELGDHRILLTSESNFQQYDKKTGWTYSSLGLISFTMKPCNTVEDIIILPKKQEFGIDQAGTRVFVRPNDIYYFYSGSVQNMERQEQKEMRSNMATVRTATVARYNLTNHKMVRYALSDEKMVFVTRGIRECQDRNVYFSLLDFSDNPLKNRILEVTLE